MTTSDERIKAQQTEEEHAMAVAYHAQATFNNDELNAQEQLAYAKMNNQQISREELTAQRDKYKEDSVMLNHIGYKMARALGLVGDDGSAFYGNVEDLVDALIRKANANG